MPAATDNSRESNTNTFKHTSPIPILTAPRRRGASVSSSSSDGSPNSPPSLQTPVSPYPPNLATSPTSPILSYFMSTSPKTSATASFPFRRASGFGTGPVFEGRFIPDGLISPTSELPIVSDEDNQDYEPPSAVHSRRATTGRIGNGRPAQQPAVPPAAPPVIEAQQARGQGVLRRLSLSGFSRPAIPVLNRSASPPRPATPPPSAVTPTAANATNRGDKSPGRRVRRAATLGVSSDPRRRAPSPMGERILKGHFDGFN